MTAPGGNTSHAKRPAQNPPGAHANQPALGRGTLAGAIALRRPLSMLGLLLAEYLVVSYLFDVQPLIFHAGLQDALGDVGSLGPLLAVVVTATVLVGGRPLLEELARILARHGRSRTTSAMLLMHLMCFPAVLYVTDQVTEAGPSVTGGQLVPLAVLAVIMLMTALLVAIPWSALGAVVRGLGRPLAAGLLSGVLAWLAGLGSAGLWNTLSLWTMRLVASMLRPFTNHLVYEPADAIVGTETFYVRISPECSGYEGIGLITVFLLAYLWVERRRLRFPHAYLLLPAAVAVVWVGNAVRIVLLIGMGVAISPAVALGGFHSKAGWLLFCGIGLVSVAVTRRVRFFQARTHASAKARDRDDARAAPADAPEDVHGNNPTATFLSPLLVLIATKLVTGLFIVDFDALYPVAVLTVAVTLVALRKRLPELRWSPSWHGPLIGALLFPVWLWTFPDVSPHAAESLSASIDALPAGYAVAWLAFRVLGSCLTVPIAEELAFRGYLLRRLIDGDFSQVEPRRLTAGSLIGSSLAFGALHQAYLGGTLAGLAFALSQRARGRLGDAIAAHVVVNTLIAGHVLLHDAYYLWL